MTLHHMDVSVEPYIFIYLNSQTHDGNPQVSLEKDLDPIRGLIFFLLQGKPENLAEHVMKIMKA